MEDESHSEFVRAAFEAQSEVRLRGDGEGTRWDLSAAGGDHGFVCRLDVAGEQATETISLPVPPPTMSALLDYANLDLASTPGVPPPGLAGPSQSPVATAQTARTILGQHTEVLVQSYADRVFVLITQLGRIGSLVRTSSAPQLPS
jgi:hypothetical protein